MRILIVGAKGFIGSHFVDYFNSKGDEVFKVISSGIASNTTFLVNQLDPDFHSILDSNYFDLIINASGSKGVGFSWENTEEDHKLNVVVNQKLLQAVLDSGQNPKIIHFSSAAVYGNPQELPIKESFEPAPISPYGFHKLQAENLMQEYARLYNLNTVSLRVFSVYGPGLRKQLLWDVYQKLMAAKDGEIILYGTGKESRDFIFIDDLVFAVQQIIQKGEFTGRAYNVANGIEVSIHELVEKYLSNFSKKVELKFGGEMKKGDPVNWRADISSLSELGYQPKIEIEEGLQSYSKWIENA
ncbi:MAG: NAD-dependent epimerase/dehydratase family protein [Crocinitomicaceae bacterium]|nr:NAD-dependent epimerase/dehydratase family protein [Crocinitomicaceae bacterium]